MQITPARPRPTQRSNRVWVRLSQSCGPSSVLVQVVCLRSLVRLREGRLGERESFVRRSGSCLLRLLDALAAWNELRCCFDPTEFSRLPGLSLRLFLRFWRARSVHDEKREVSDAGRDKHRCLSGGGSSPPKMGYPRCYRCNCRRRGVSLCACVPARMFHATLDLMGNQSEFRARS